MAAREKNASTPLIWEIDVGLLNNRMIWRGLLTMIIATYLVVMLLMGFILLGTGEAENIPSLALVFALICAGIFVLMLAVMLLIFGNRMRMKFRLDDKGLRTELTDRRAKTGSRLAAIVGLLAGKPGLAGAGLIAATDEIREYQWSQVASARFHDRAGVITIRNDWRPIADLFCPPEIYPMAAEKVRTALARHLPKRTPRRYPVLQPLLQSFGIFLAVGAAFTLPYPFEIDLFAIIFTLCFARATVWIIPLLAYPVLLGVAVMVGTVIYRGLEKHDAMFGGEPFSGFDSLYGDEWLALAVFALGMGYLVFFCVQMLRGRWMSVLVRDETE
ncbi:MAG: hypothetical protein KDJ16_04875 [Hyphomicrobiales bacterium]|nr:hypothetical protein [Hyphomicrobiales bacterium]